VGGGRNSAPPPPAQKHVLDLGHPASRIEEIDLQNTAGPPLHLRWDRFSFLARMGVVRLFVCARATLDRRIRLGEKRNIGV
jgi:hypothetical protein